MGTEQPPPVGVPVESVFERMTPKLRRYFRFKGFGDDAEDMVQECFRRISGRRAEAPEAYLMRAATNLAAEQWRSWSRRHREQHVTTDSLDLGGPDPLAQLEAADLLRRVEASLARLKPRTREIFIQRRVEGLSLAELAELHGLSIKGVERQLTKAIGYLRRHYGDRL